MGMSLPKRRLFNFTSIAALIVLGFKYLSSRDNQLDVRSDVVDRGNNPRNIDRWEEINSYERRSQEQVTDGHHTRTDAMYEEPTYNKTKLRPSAKPLRGEDLMRRGIAQPSSKNEYQARDNNNSNNSLEAEMVRRRAAFFDSIDARKQTFNESDFEDIHEKDDDFPFVTAGSHSTYMATIQFVYSIQYFYPKSRIVIYDIGLTGTEKDYLNSLCQTEVADMWLHLWPESIYRIRHHAWRPLLLQFAMSKLGHFVYVEPGRFVHRQRIQDYIRASRRHGAIFVGEQLSYSTFVVTNPHMFTFLMTDERKLQTTQHFRYNLAILHNTHRVKHELMRHLVACTMEEFCIAPPGSKSTCDPTTGSNKRYARCHRYDESALNLIVNRWFNYQPTEYLVRDSITNRHDGNDMTSKVKVCRSKVKNEKSERRDEV